MNFQAPQFDLPEQQPRWQFSLRDLFKLVSVLSVLLGVVGLGSRLIDRLWPAPAPIAPAPRNWTDGSCVSASKALAARFEAELLLPYRPFTYSQLCDLLQKSGRPYVSTSSGDENLLNHAAFHERMALISYYPGNVCAFVGMDDNNAYIYDRNRCKVLIAIPRAEFLSRWKGYGGIAIVPMGDTTKPIVPLWQEASLDAELNEFDERNAP